MARERPSATAVARATSASALLESPTNTPTSAPQSSEYAAPSVQTLREKGPHAPSMPRNGVTCASNASATAGAGAAHSRRTPSTSGEGGAT